MQVRSEQRCWQKRKVREEDNNIKKRSKIRGYSKFDRYIFIYEFIKFIKLVFPLLSTLFIGLSVQVGRINDRKEMTADSETLNFMSFIN